MPARSVNQINITNWTATANSPRVPQYSVDIYIHWTDMNGVDHQHSDTYLFPNELADIPLFALKEFIAQIIKAKVRVTLGIDTWEDYR